MSFGQFLDHDITQTPGIPSTVSGEGRYSFLLLLYFVVATAFNGLNFNCRSCNSETEISPNCRPIPIDQSDPFIPAILNVTTGEPRCMPFIRSITGRTALGAREQINQITGYIDASNIYGSSLCRANRLRLFKNGTYRLHKVIL